MSHPTPRTGRFPKMTNSYVTYRELRESHETLERENAAMREALENIRRGLSNTKVCCGNPIPGHPGNYWEPPDAPECCREPDMLHDIIDDALKENP